MFDSSFRMTAFIIGFLLVGGVAFHSARAMAAEQEKIQPPSQSSQSIVVAGGCFWGVQAVFQHVKGVHEAVSGYAGGEADTAHYDTVSTGMTGHAESVKVTFDPAVVSLAQILNVYFTVAHDPTELNRQGPDSGTQYRSAVFYSDEAQHQAALQAAKNAQANFSSPVVTQIVPLKAFYSAEEYHQNYFNRHPDNPYICANDKPKVFDLKKRFPELYQDVQS